MKNAQFALRGWLLGLVWAGCGGNSALQCDEDPLSGIEDTGEVTYDDNFLCFYGTWAKQYCTLASGCGAPDPGCLQVMVAVRGPWYSSFEELGCKVSDDAAAACLEQLAQDVATCEVVSLLAPVCSAGVVYECPDESELSGAAGPLPAQ